MNWLQHHRARIGELSSFAEAAGEIARLPLQLLPLDVTLLSDAAAIARQHGRLTNDAITFALLRRHAIAELVTNDDDFDSLPGVTVWKPR